MAIQPSALEKAADEHLAQTGLLLDDRVPASLVTRALSNYVSGPEGADEFWEQLLAHAYAAHAGLFEAFPNEDRRELGATRVGLHKALRAAIEGVVTLGDAVCDPEDGPTITMLHVRRVLELGGVDGLKTGLALQRLRAIYGRRSPLANMPLFGPDFIT